MGSGGLPPDPVLRALAGLEGLYNRAVAKRVIAVDGEGLNHVGVLADGVGEHFSFLPFFETLPASLDYIL